MAVNKLIHVGFGNIVNAGKIIAIVSPDSAPVRRLVSQAKNDGRTIDATQGRKTKSVIVMENDRIVLSALLPETIREIITVTCLITAGRKTGMQTPSMAVC